VSGLVRAAYRRAKVDAKTMNDLSKTPFREVDWLPVELDVDTRPDGTILMASCTKVAQGLPHLPAYLHLFGEQRPDAIWLARRAGPEGPWQQLSFAEACAKVDALTQALLDLELPKGRPLAILSGNTIEHALIMFAAMQASIPVAPLSPSYSLLSKDHLKLRRMLEIVEPAAFFVQDGQLFQNALAAVADAKPVIYVDHAPDGVQSLAFDKLTATKPSRAVRQAVAEIDPQAPAKFMFTSGSTGTPKAVAQCQAAIVAAVLSTVQTFKFSPEQPSVRLDWTPWNHVFGFVNLCLSLLTGGQFYIDDGKPVEPLIRETLRNLREISPTVYANVPAGYAMLVPHLEADDELARSLFHRLEQLAYAGARLSDDIAERLQRLAVKATGKRVPFISGFGATETGPSGSFVHWPTQEVGLIGLPQPGVQFKLVPLQSSRYEVRLRGPALMLGYHKDGEQTARAFDDEGFYCLGDAATLVDPADLKKGLRFSGRIVEDFKLQTGIFVQATQLRSDLLLAAAPYLQELVVCGADRAFVAIMAWPNLSVVRKQSGNESISLADAAQWPPLVEQVREALRRHNAEQSGSSRRVHRFVLLATPPSLDRGEVTDKGSVNSRAVQQHRLGELERLFAESEADDIHRV
jgi:feruloyl-CoA synthase